MNRKQSRADKKRNKGAQLPPDLFLLGHKLWEQGRLDEAEAAFHRLAAIPFDGAHAGLGGVLWEQGKFEAAQDAYQRAIARKPDDVLAHAGLGNVLKDRGDLDGAVGSYRRALMLRPDLAEAHNNLGNALKDLGQLPEAVASYRQSLVLQPDFVQAQNNLAVALWDQGMLEEASLVLGRIVESHPAYVTALNNLAALRAQQGDAAGAMTVLRQSLQRGETPKARSIFIDIMRAGRWAADNDAVRTLIARALTEPWGRPGDLAQVSADLLKLDVRIGACIVRAAAAWPQILSADELYGPQGPGPLTANPLLCAFLTTTQNADLEMEQFLTAARHLLLESATASGDDHEVLAFHAALARQCFINDYVFSQSAAEIAQADALCARLDESLKANADIPALWLVAIAAYRPLGALPQAGRLLERQWPQELLPLLAQQISEPKMEARLRADIFRLTDIADGISRAVREQYEENPYPRWTLTAPGERLNGIGTYLARKFPLAHFQRRGANASDILIAGCGTGQQSIEAAQRFRNARVLALDLSLSSLAYAKRKSLELELAGMEYAQADILELGGLECRFDLIESVGVLHHMAEPFSGWKTLLSLLRPGGFMLVGLYSWVARQTILRARDFIAARGYQPTPSDIRRCRQEIMAAGESGDFSPLLKLPDFFGMSTCRDLLFHVQERYVSLAEIADFLRAQDLTFLGFEVRRDLLQTYRQRFPDDPAATDFSQWQIFENENPETFSGMVQLWVQKPA